MGNGWVTLSPCRHVQLGKSSYGFFLASESSFHSAPANFDTAVTEEPSDGWKGWGPKPGRGVRVSSMVVEMVPVKGGR